MAKIFGQLEKAQLENTTSDTASLPKGTATYRTDLNLPKVSNGTTMKTLVDTDTAQTLSTKTLDNTTILQSPTVEGAAILQEIATPATPSSGYGKIYFKSDGKLYQLNDDGTETEVGSGGGSGINYITNSDAESNTTGYTTYADAAASRPVDGTGGSPTVTWTRSTSSPLRGTANFLFTKDAANRQGEGVSYDFTIDSADQGKVLQISFDYAIASGTYSGGSSSTDSDLIAYIYRTTATGRLIEPSVIKLDGGVAGVNYSYRGEFQADSDATGYRLILHVATTSASAFTVKFDNIVVGPSKNVQGAITTEWQSYTPNFLGSTNGLAFTNATTLGRWRRIGDSVELDITTNFTGTPATGTGNFTWSLPSGLVMDTAKMASSGAKKVIGVATGTDAGVDFKAGAATPFGTTAISAISNLGPDNWSLTVPQTWTTNDQATLRALVPIVGWGATATLGQDADTRVAAASYGHAASTSLANNTDTAIAFDTIDYDTHGAFNTSNGRYTAPVAGYYRVSSTITLTADNGWAVTERLSVEVRVNGSSSFPNRKVLAETSGLVGTSVVARASGTAMLYLKAGDYFQVFVNQNSGGAITLNGSTVGNHMEVSRVSGPSQVAATEVVAAHYTGATTSVSSSQTTIIMPTKFFDTHNAYNSSTGIFTCPTAGKYRYTIAAQSSTSVSGTANAEARIRVQKNSSDSKRVSTFKYQASVSLTPIYSVGSVTYDCIAGDTLTAQITVGASGIGAHSLDGLAEFCYAIVEKIN